MKLALVFHGWTGSPVKFCLPLADKMDEVIYPTLSGHAYASDNEYEKAIHLAQFSDEDWINDVYSQLEKALQRNAAKIYIFTHSMGLYLVACAIEQLEFEGKMEGKIEKIVSYGAPEKTRLMHQLILVLSRFPLLHQLSRLNRWKFRQYQGINLVYKGGAEGANQWVAWSNITDLVNVIRKGKLALQKLTVPLVVIQGTKDGTVHPSSVKRICDRVPSETVAVLIEGAHHSPNRDEMVQIVQEANV